MIHISLSDAIEQKRKEEKKIIDTKMITITTSYIVTPNDETPKGCLWLPESDQIVTADHIPTIYIYKGKHNYNNVMDKMRDSLSKVLVYYYPIAGRLSYIEGGRLQLNCNSKGVMLVEAMSTRTLADYGDFSPNELTREFIPVVDHSQPNEEIPLVLVQITRFEDDEGIVIGTALSHPLCDGLAGTCFFNAWAKVARGETLGPDEVPFLDRTALKSSDPPLAPRFDHLELKSLPFIIGRSNHLIEQKKKTTFKLLKLTSNQVEILKKNANNSQSQEQGKKPYSRFEVIGAHIWRCASKARDLDENQPSVVRFNGDIRNRINPPLPHNYFGNALAPVVTPTCYIGEIISNPISYVAEKIREGVSMLTNEYIRSQLDYIAQQKQVSFIRVSESTQENNDIIPFYGNPNLALISWMSFPACETDFGWGKPVYFGPGAVSPFDRATIMLSPDGDGSIMVFMTFQVEHIEKFIKCFWEDLCEVGTNF